MIKKVVLWILAIILTLIKKVVLWILAILLTLGAAKYQRATGPTYPISGELVMDSSTPISYSLARSHGGDDDMVISIPLPDEMTSATLYYKRYTINEAYTAVPMLINGENLTASLPHQPPAGKLEYYIELHHGDNTYVIPANNAVVTRFKGHVPAYILIPHILFMFLAMLMSSRTGLEALDPNGNTKIYTYITMTFLAIGGLILGPFVQKFAFDAFWTGIPWGWDLTDNKTLIAVIGWAAAVYKHKDSPFPRYWVIGAAILLFAVYLIPHSAMGSELNYETGEVMTG